MDKKELAAYMARIGKRGGRATVERYGPEHFARAAAARKVCRGRFSKPLTDDGAGQTGDQVQAPKKARGTKPKNKAEGSSRK